MRRLCLGLFAPVLLASCVLAAPAVAQEPAAVEVIDAKAGPSDPTMLSGYVGYSGRADGAYALMVRRPDGRVLTQPLRQKSVFNTDLGTDAAGRIVLTFTRCSATTKGSCDAWVWPVQAESAPRRVRETPTAGRQDHVSMWRGVVTWSQTAPGGRVEVYQNRSGASATSAKRLWRSATSARSQRVQRLDSSNNAQAWTLTADLGGDRDSAELYVRASGRVVRRVRSVSTSETSVDVQGVQIAAGRVWWVQASGRFSASTRTAVAYRMSLSGTGKQSHAVPDDTIAIAPDGLTGADRVLLAEDDLLFTGQTRERRLRLVDLPAWK